MSSDLPLCGLINSLSNHVVSRKFVRRDDLRGSVDYSFKSIKLTMIIVYTRVPLIHDYEAYHWLLAVGEFPVESNLVKCCRMNV